MFFKLKRVSLESSRGDMKNYDLIIKGTIYSETPSLGHMLQSVN